MSRKKISAMSHNWSDSFVSYSNSEDGIPIIEELRNIVRTGNRHSVAIQWIPFPSQVNSSLPAGVKSAVVKHEQHLNDHVAISDVDILNLKELRTEVIRLESHQIVVEAVAIDDQGRGHRQRVAT